MSSSKIILVTAAATPAPQVRQTMALFNKGALSVRIMDDAARGLALSLAGATKGRVQRSIDIPGDHSDQWDTLIGLAVEGSGFMADTPSAEPGEPGSPVSPVDGLVQLTELHAQGALSDEESAAAKARLLGL
jgi:hypothetical protein